MVFWIKSRICCCRAVSLGLSSIEAPRGGLDTLWARTYCLRIQYLYFNQFSKCCKGAMGKTLVFLGTGGTIAGKAAFAQTTWAIPQRNSVAQLLEGVSGLESAVEGAARWNTSRWHNWIWDMEHAVWSRLAQRIRPILRVMRFAPS